jgi:hypothetical protein
MREWVRGARAQIAFDLLALLMPLDFYWPTGRWTVFGVDNIYVSPLLYLSDIALVALMALLVASFSQSYQKDKFRWHKFQWHKFQWRGYPLLYTFLALGCLAVLTAPFALNRSLAAYTALRWWLAVALSLHLMFARFNVQRFTTIFLLGMFVQVLIGASQALLQRPIGLPGEMALSLSQPGAAVVAIAEQNWLRAYGLTFHPNVLGGYLVVALLLAVPYQWRPEWGMTKRLSVWWSLTWIFLWWVLWGGLLLTFSRSALLAALVTVPLAVGWAFWRAPSSRFSLGIALAGLLLIGAGGAALFPEQVTTRLDISQATEWLSLAERQAQVEVALNILSSRPLAGVGAGNFPWAVSAFALDVRALPVHNVPLLLAAEVGALGGAVWIWALWVAVALLVRWMPRHNGWVVMGLCAWLALWLIGLFDYYPWGLNSGRLLSATIVGLTGHVILDDKPVRG